MRNDFKRGEILVENSNLVNKRKCIFLQSEQDDNVIRHAVVWLDENGYPESIQRVDANSVMRPDPNVHQMSSIDVSI